MTTEKCMVFCPYRTDGWLPGASNHFLIAPVFDERDIREGLGGGVGHEAMIPLYYDYQ
jgi:hypothetical protein